MPDLARNSMGAVIALALVGGIAYATERHTTMELTSSAFAPNTDIPSLHTCEGSDLSPRWRGPAYRPRPEAWR